MKPMVRPKPETRPYADPAPVSILIARYFSMGAIASGIDDARNSGRSNDFVTLSDALRLSEGKLFNGLPE